MASTVGAVDTHGSGTFPWTTSTGTRHTDRVKHLPDVGRIAALAGGNEDGQRQTVSI